MSNPFEPVQPAPAETSAPAGDPGAIPAPPPVVTQAVVPQPPPAPAPGKGGGPRRGYSRWVFGVLAPVLAVVDLRRRRRRGQHRHRERLDPGRPDGGSGGGGSGNELALISEAWKAIQDNYVDAKNLNDRDLAYGAIRGLTEAVGDEGHTSFLTADEAKAVDQSLSGTFVGIGVQLDSDETKGPIIRSIIPGTPAEEAGLKRGDLIVKVDGTTTTGESIDEVVSRVRGPEGEAVTLTIQRGSGDPFDVKIVRKQFDLPLVSWAMVPGRKVAMIRLDQFATGATQGIEDAIKGAKEDGATAIVFDLRGNPGGYVNEAVGVASQFVGDGTVYQSVDASGVEKDVPVQPGGLATSIPLVVLTDGGTASSAEIVTGAIQDASRGKVVGDKTFGTGTVLGRFDLSDGSSLRIGVERWLTRNGRPIWHEGLEPDVKVTLGDTVAPLLPDDIRDMTPASLAKSDDTQLLKALELLKGEG